MAYLVPRRAGSAKPDDVQSKQMQQSTNQAARALLTPFRLIGRHINGLVFDCPGEPNMRCRTCCYKNQPQYKSDFTCAVPMIRRVATTLDCIAKGNPPEGVSSLVFVRHIAASDTVAPYVASVLTAAATAVGLPAPVVGPAPPRRIQTPVPTLVPETHESPVPETHESLVPETQETLVPETQETLVPETHESPVPETQESLVPETHESLVPETHESLVPATPQIQSGRRRYPRGPRRGTMPARIVVWRSWFKDTEEGRCYVCNNTFPFAPPATPVAPVAPGTHLWHRGHIVCDAGSGPGTLDNLVPECAGCSLEHLDVNLLEYACNVFPHLHVGHHRRDDFPLLDPRLKEIGRVARNVEVTSLVTTVATQDESTVPVPVTVTVTVTVPGETTNVEADGSAVAEATTPSHSPLEWLDRA